MPQEDKEPEERSSGDSGYTPEQLRLRQEAWAELEAHRARLAPALSSIEEHSSSWEEDEEE